MKIFSLLFPLNAPRINRYSLQSVESPRVVTDVEPPWGAHGTFDMANLGFRPWTVRLAA